MNEATAALAFAALGLAAIATPAAPLAPGDYRFELDLDSRTRSYLVHVPPQAAAGALPVVINLHGGGGNAQQHRESTGMDAAADRDGYIVVYPNGTGRLSDRLLTWNAGACCGYAMNKGVDDVKFISRLIDDVGARAAVDPRRICVAGHSNGGMMAHRAGEELPGRIAAIASVAGARVPSREPSSPAMPVLHIHSVDDPRALYRGGLGPPFPFTNSRVMHPPVEEMLAAWVQRDGCAARPQDGAALEREGHTARLRTWSQCRDGAEVRHWLLTGAGHGWPGVRPAMEKVVGPATKVIDANAEIWAFFRKFALAGDVQ